MFVWKDKNKQKEAEDGWFKKCFLDPLKAHSHKLHTKYKYLHATDSET